jgi:molybdate transport system substrate-binding protein
VRLVAALTAVLLMIGCGGVDSDEETVVRVAAASDLQPALEALRPLLDAEGVDLQATYGGSGTFLQQIVNGAPYDLYLSADQSYPRQLVDRGLAEPPDLFPYAVGRLVLWVPEGSALDPADGLAILTGPDVERVAIANPEHAPYGRAALAALAAAGIEAQVRPKLVRGENVAQAADFVVSGGADAGIVARSSVVSDALQDVGRWQELAAPGLEQGGVVLRDSAPARRVRDVLLSDAGQAVLTRAGFGRPGR